MNKGAQHSHNGEERHYADGGQVPVAPREWSQFLFTTASRFDLTVEQMMEIVEEFEDFAVSRRDARTTHKEIPHGFEEVAVIDQREATDNTKGIRMVRRGLRQVICAPTLRQQSFLLKCLMLAFGWHDDLDGITTPTELARRFGVTKANADKFVCQFRDSVPDAMEALPLAPGQRKEEARVKFARIRREQEKRRVKRK